jgi:hypothetical protein
VSSEDMIGGKCAEDGMGNPAQAGRLSQAGEGMSVAVVVDGGGSGVEG